MRRHVFVTFLVALAVGCAAGSEPEAGQVLVSTSAEELVVGGCQCVSSGTCSQLSYSDIPPNGEYVVTTFGGGSDTQSMACGGIADGTWAYVAGSARFSCGTKLLVEANGKHCVAQVADCGPNRCVEEAASGSCGTHSPVLDASPFITKYLIGQSQAGWSERKTVTAKVIDSSSVVGCPGNPVTGSGGSGGNSGNGGSGAGGSTGSCTAPTCLGCGDCNSVCMCESGIQVFCDVLCGSAPGGTGGTTGTGGSPGSGGTPASGGTPGAAGFAGAKGDVGDEGGCEAPACNGCEGCDDLCLCEGNDAATCAKKCGTPTIDACKAPECTGCGSCHETCACGGLSEATCVNVCGGAAPEPQFQPPRVQSEQPESCGASSIVGVRRSREGASWPYLALLAFAAFRRRRKR